MKAYVITGLDQLPVRFPGTDIPVGQPLPAGASIDQVIDIEPNGFNAGKFVAWADAFAQAAQRPELKAVVPQGVNFVDLASRMASGASAGSLVPPPGVGALIGAVVMAFVWIAQNWRNLFGGGTPPHYATPQVHDWATKYLPQAVLDWARDADPNMQFGSISQMAQMTLIYWLETYGAVIVKGQQTSFYSGKPDDVYINALGQDPQKFYQGLGVNYQATKALRTTTGNKDQRHLAQYSVKVQAPGSTDLGALPLLAAGALAIYATRKP